MCLCGCVQIETMEAELAAELEREAQVVQTSRIDEEEDPAASLAGETKGKDKALVLTETGLAKDASEPVDDARR